MIENLELLVLFGPYLFILSAILLIATWNMVEGIWDLFFNW